MIRQLTLPDREQAQNLLATLCEKLGFCLPPNEQERLVHQPPMMVYDFADEVFVAGGPDPGTDCKRLLEGVRVVVYAAFLKLSEAADQQV